MQAGKDSNWRSVIRVRFTNSRLPERQHNSDDSRAVRYNDGMRVPHRNISPIALRAVVEEFVTRDGTDYSDIERRVAIVLRQLDLGQVNLYFDHNTQTCTIRNANVNLPDDDQAS